MEVRVRISQRMLVSNHGVTRLGAYFSRKPIRGCVASPQSITLGALVQVRLISPVLCLSVGSRQQP